MQDWIIQMMDQFGYWGIGGLIAIENIFPPIPSEVILTFGGFMTTYTSLNVWLVILAATLGSLVGAIILYGIGRIISPKRLEKILAGRLGKILRLKPEDIGKAEAWFQKRGKLTVFFCRFIPIVRSLISLPAGMAKIIGYFSPIKLGGYCNLEYRFSLAGCVCRRFLGKNCRLYGHLFLHWIGCICSSNYHLDCCLLQKTSF